MKRIAWLLLLAFCLVTLAGCGSAPKPETKPTQQVQQKTPQQLLDESYTKEAAKKSPKPVSTAANYIGNSNSKKFHLPTCGSAAKISSANRVTFANRADAVSAGYQPCKQCKP
jgi:hypothetical protein